MANYRVEYIRLLEKLKIVTEEYDRLLRLDRQFFQSAYEMSLNPKRTTQKWNLLLTFSVALEAENKEAAELLQDWMDFNEELMQLTINHAELKKEMVKEISGRMEQLLP